jgi:hypothetical protein
MRCATEIQEAAQITVASTSCARSGVCVAVISRMVRRDVNRRVGLGDTIVNGSTGAVVVRVGITAVKAPRIGRVIPGVLVRGATEIQ